jgi:hypothetical protein
VLSALPNKSRASPSGRLQPKRAPSAADGSPAPVDALDGGFYSKMRISRLHRPKLTVSNEKFGTDDSEHSVRFLLIIAFGDSIILRYE